MGQISAGNGSIVDTFVFNAHSVRRASSVAATNLGITTNDLFQVAEWGSESVFQGKPTEEIPHMVQQCCQQLNFHTNTGMTVDLVRLQMAIACIGDAISA